MKNKTNNLRKIVSGVLVIVFMLAMGGVQPAQATGLSTFYNLTGDQDGEEYGFPTRFIGDVNADGREDFAIGSLAYDVGAVEDVGRVQIYSGATGALIREHTQPFVTTASESAFFGSAVTGIGDANGDSREDYVILDPRFSTGEGGAIFNERGRVIAYSGNDGSVLWTYKGTTDYQFQFGNVEMVSARDFNSDGKRDVAVGAPGLNAGQAGGIIILSAIDGSLVTQYSGTLSEGFIGTAFDTGFDINGDSTEDFVIGEPFTTNTNFWDGSIRVISGANLASPTTIWSIAAPVSNRFGFFGLWTTASADTNNDGRADFAASSRETVSGLVRAGSSRVFSGITGSVLNKYDGSAQQDNFGVSLANLGDVNNDGYADIGVSSLANNGAGRADAYQSKGGVQWDKIPGGAAGEAVGSDIDGGKDINADGVPDLILGSSGGQVGPIFPGRARVVISDPTHVNTGSSVEVISSATRLQDVVTFTSVSGTGNITFTYLNQTSTGANFRTRQANKSEYWSITTDATFSGSITVCLKYNQAALGYDETSINLQHLEGSYATKTTSRDATNDVVCGAVTSL